MYPDFEHMTIEEVKGLSAYQQHRYRVWVEGRKKKKEIQSDFNNFLNKSCEKYREE